MDGHTWLVALGLSPIFGPLLTLLAWAYLQPLLSRRRARTLGHLMGKHDRPAHLAHTNNALTVADLIHREQQAGQPVHLNWTQNDEHRANIHVRKGPDDTLGEWPTGILPPIQPPSR